MVDKYLLQFASNCKYYLTSLITKPTTITSNSRSCIDHILARCLVNLNLESWVVDAGVTDHRMTVFCLKIDKMVKTVNKSIKNKKLNFELFKKKIEERSWDEVFLADNVLLAFESFISSLKLVC